MDTRIVYILKLTNVIHYTDRIKDKNHITISMGKKKKASHKNQHPFIVKVLIKIAIEGPYPELIKAIYD